MSDCEPERVINGAIQQSREYPHGPRKPTFDTDRENLKKKPWTKRKHRALRQGPRQWLIVVGCRIIQVRKMERIESEIEPSQQDKEQSDRNAG
jgi:hypothetical protein